MTPDEPSEALKEFLLEEYRALSEAFWKSEESGETRVNWFIGIVTGVVGGLAWLAASADSSVRGEPLRLIVLASLAALLAFGLVTLLRIFKRNEATDTYKRGCQEIRQRFKDHFDDDLVLLGHHPFRPLDNSGKRKAGGLAHTVATINSLILGSLAGVLAHPIAGAPAADQLFCIMAAALAVFGLAYWQQSKLVEHRELENKRLMDQDKATHAGGATYRTIEGRVQYLLVGPKKENPGEWLLPKGHIEKGEEPREAAVREIAEEAGVLARAICLAGKDRFTANNEQVVVSYYLLESFGAVPPAEARRHDWFDYEEALQLLTHVQNKHVLRQAEARRLERLVPPAGD